MTTKTSIATALVVSVLGLSAASAETVYVGGPKGGFETRQAVQPNKPYAQYVPAPSAAVNKHIYLGGPKSTILHDRGR